MIVVIGSPSLLPADPGGRPAAAGPAVDVARGATDAGSSVQLIGKIGDDPAGDALLLALADAGIGHVAILRDPARATPVAQPAADEFEPMLPGDDDQGEAASRRAVAEPRPGSLPTIDAGDLDLALRYLPDHQVVIVAERLDPEALAVVAADCSYVGAALAIILEAGGPGSTDLPPEATAFEAPASDPDGVFGRTIGRFGAALEQGLGGAAALAQATTGGGWQPAAG
ncbi:MAG TPA: hypothetical protein VKR24_04765 [Candidatus Limnocylindrales bacterium]|nr:hypothetical protein [Candidatus Limnocylindrales bacterium]